MNRDTALNVLNMPDLVDRDAVPRFQWCIRSLISLMHSSAPRPCKAECGPWQFDCVVVSCHCMLL